MFSAGARGLAVSKWSSPSTYSSIRRLLSRETFRTQNNVVNTEQDALVTREITALVPLKQENTMIQKWREQLIRTVSDHARSFSWGALVGGAMVALAGAHLYDEQEKRHKKAMQAEIQFQLDQFDTTSGIPHSCR